MDLVRATSDVCNGKEPGSWKGGKMSTHDAFPGRNTISTIGFVLKSVLSAAKSLRGRYVYNFF
jgi:hypothetical protein